VCVCVCVCVYASDVPSAILIRAVVCNDSGAPPVYCITCVSFLSGAAAAAVAHYTRVLYIILFYYYVGTHINIQYGIVV